MADTSYGFRYRGRKCGRPPTIQSFVAQLMHAMHIARFADVQRGDQVFVLSLTEVVEHIVRFSAAGMRATAGGVRS